MKRKTFITSLFISPLLIKEILSAKPIDISKKDAWIEFEVPYTRMNWQMKVTDIDEDTIKIFNNRVLPEFWKDPFGRYRNKKGLIKLRKARR
jgi:hypothetical protein